MIVIAIIAMLALDAIWMTLNKSRYQKLVQDVQKKVMNIKIISAICAYILMITGLVYIICPLVRANKVIDANNNKFIIALKYGGLFGLVVYGIFNATNYAIFENYSMSTAVIDTLWGCLLYTIVTYIAI